MQFAWKYPIKIILHFMRRSTEILCCFAFFHFPPLHTSHFLTPICTWTTWYNKQQQIHNTLKCQRTTKRKWKVIPKIASQIFFFLAYRRHHQMPTKFFGGWSLRISWSAIQTSLLEIKKGNLIYGNTKMCIRSIQEEIQISIALDKGPSHFFFDALNLILVFSYICMSLCRFKLFFNFT